MAAEKPAAANNDKFNTIMIYLRHCKQGKLDLDAAAKDEALGVASRKACYDKLNVMLKKEGLTVGGVFNTSAAGAPATSASKAADGEKDGAKKTKRAPRSRKKAKGEDGEEVKAGKKRKADEAVEGDDEGDDGTGLKDIELEEEEE